ncbi:MAG: hypothetical protein DUD26_06755 [Eubacteriaceae bacterium]|nr:MAG: hypothetical protein DUD26_06755 [Eubacteriaceae bacterium]
MARLVEAEAEPLALVMAESDWCWETDALVLAESDRVRLCCSLAAAESESLSEAFWLSSFLETLIDVIWLAASDRLLVSASS